MGNKNKTILKYVIFFIIGIAIFIWVYSGQDTEKIISSLKNANYWWIALSLVLGIFSHVSRAIRWNLLITPMGYKPRFVNSFFSVLIMYLSNTAMPRSGEFVRCGVMSKYEKVPFSKLLGTVVTERVFDFIMLFILLAVVLITQMPVVSEIIENNPKIAEKFEKVFSAEVILSLMTVAVIFAILLYIFRKKIQKTKIYKKIKEFVLNFTEGVKTVLKMKKKGAFIFHTVLIWVLYFIMLYVVFFSFDFTSHFTILMSLTVFVAASFGMVFPSPGGIGSWHFMVIQTLLIYGVSDESDAGAYAFAAHGSMTLLLIILGVVSIILLPIVNKKRGEEVVR